MPGRWERARAASPLLATDVVQLVQRPEVVARARLVCLCITGLLLAHASFGGVLASGYEPLSTALAEHGLTTDDADAIALRAQRLGNEPQRVILRASAPGELGDVWLGEAVIARSGMVADLRRLHNMTQTTSADESRPVLLDRWALYARRVQGHVVGFEVIDLAGEAAVDRGLLARIQRGVTNLQTTGRWSGVGRRSYMLEVPAEVLVTRVEGRVFVLELDGARAVIDPLQERAVEGSGLFEVRSHRPSVAAPLPWLVDTVRDLSFVGAERVAWLENRAFALRDRGMRLYHSVHETDHAAQAAKDLGIDERKLSRVEDKVERLAVPNPESGWPPPSLDPLNSAEPVLGEGKWRAIVDDPHVRALPSGGPVFYQTFLHTDPERTWARVYLTVWDPRLVQLHIVAGTEEPVSATGETGSGVIPRTPETLTRLVGAFNGGFQAMHGEFGMMADGRVYLPPKPWAATVALFEDGRVGMGSWPGPADRRAQYDEARAVADIPAGMVAFRQNLTSLVEGDRFNPWGRWWWGAAPQQRSEQTLTQRSALCFTREGFMIYAWGDSASPEALGSALLRARCVRALHLDMNAGHSGMELYNVLGPTEPRSELQSREPHRYEGTLAALPGFTVRARKAVTAMGMALPRYLRSDPRDFFYLTLKRGIEGSPPASDEFAFSPSDLPHAGWPPAFSRYLSEDVRVLRIDTARAVPELPPGRLSDEPLAELRGSFPEPELDHSALYSVQGNLRRRFAVGVAPPGAEVLLGGPLLAATDDAQAAVGIDAQGLLVYAECGDKCTAALRLTLAKLGVESAIALPRGVRLGLRFREGLLSLDARARIKEPRVALRFVANASPAVELLYPDNTPIPYARWAALQDKRVRYFRTSEPTSRVPVGAATP